MTEAASRPDSTDDVPVDADARPGSDASGDAADTDGSVTPPGRRRRRINRQLLVASLVIGLGLAIVTRGLMVAVTGDDRAGLPDAIEEVNPVPEAEQALSQTSVFVDLVSGYTGLLIIDGVELETIDVSAVADDQVEPGAQVSIPAATVYEPGNATLTFTPGAAAAITEFDEGEHRATVLYWRLDQTQQQARHFTWTFRVI